MTYHGERRNQYPKLGIKPTKEDHALVRALSVMGTSVRELCVRLGEHYHLSKPMSRLSLYYHFRNDLSSNKRGRKEKPETIQRQIVTNIAGEMQRLISEARRRGKKEKD